MKNFFLFFLLLALTLPSVSFAKDVIVDDDCEMEEEEDC